MRLCTQFLVILAAEMNIWWLIKPRAVCHRKESSPQLLLLHYCHRGPCLPSVLEKGLFKEAEETNPCPETYYSEDGGTLADQQMGTVLWSWIKPRSMCGK
ncbi:hypothetical protein BsWGS_01244 [Bradybaena similaris]